VSSFWKYFWKGDKKSEEDRGRRPIVQIAMTVFTPEVRSFTSSREQVN